MLDKKTLQKVLFFQKNELTEYKIYSKLSAIIKNKEHAQILQKISDEELKHYEFWRSLTNIDTQPDSFKVIFYIFLARIFGLTFGLRLLEKGENLAQSVYEEVIKTSPTVKAIIAEEERHENELIGLIDEEHLKYVSSVVLGLNDAMVELTGALVGFTLALSNTRIVAIVGLITGIAASLSMAASEYLSTRHEVSDKNPLKASLITGVAYIFTVILLVTPFFMLKNAYLCLLITLSFVLLIIFVFTFYASVARDLNFKKRFGEMASISLGIAVINFGIGLIIRKVFNINI